MVIEKRWQNLKQTSLSPFVLSLSSIGEHRCGTQMLLPPSRCFARPSLQPRSVAACLWVFLLEQEYFVYWVSSSEVANLQLCFYLFLLFIYISYLFCHWSLQQPIEPYSQKLWNLAHWQRVMPRGHGVNLMWTGQRGAIANSWKCNLWTGISGSTFDVKSWIFGQYEHTLRRKKKSQLLFWRPPFPVWQSRAEGSCNLT